MNMRKVESIMNTTLSAIISLLLSFVLLAKNGELTVVSYVLASLESFFVAYFWGSVIPAPAWGVKLAGKIGLKKEGIGEHIVRTAVLAFCLVTCVSLVCTFLTIGPVDYFFVAWWSGYPLLLLTGFIGLLIMFPIVFKIAVKQST